MAIARCVERTPCIAFDAAVAARRSIDIVFCALLLVLLAIPMLLIALAVHAEDRGPTFFRQQRVGLGGTGSRC